MRGGATSSEACERKANRKMTAEMNVAELVSELTLEEKASLCLGSDFWHTRGVERLGIPSVMVTRRPARPAPAAGRGRPRRPRRQRAGDLLPDGLGAGLVVGPRPGAQRRRGGRSGGSGSRASRSCSGPASTSSARRCAGATSSTSPRTRLVSGVLGAALVRGPAVPGRRGVGEALRGQQPGDRPAAGQRRRRRAHAARDLPAGLRAGRDAGAGRGR